MSGETPAKPRMSLYANLLNQSGSGDAPGTISSGPIVYKQPGGDKNEDMIAAAKSKLSAAALRFQPTKRPTIQSQSKGKSLGAKGLQQQQQQQQPPPPPPPPPADQTTPDPPADLPGGASRQIPKTTIEDWAGDEDEDAYYLEQKRQQQSRGGRKKRKKNRENAPQPVNWDDIYDPTRPNNYDEYKNSEESFREIREWKDRLYAHRAAQRDNNLSDSDDERPSYQHRPAFAPPPMSFAPPANLNDDTPPPPPPAAAAANAPHDPTGEDAYARRMRLSQPVSVPPAESALRPPPPPPPPPADNTQPPASPNPPSSTISRAPVRYNLPTAPADIPASEAELQEALEQEASNQHRDDEASEVPDDEPRSLRPGQKGFAERMMKKYGWSKGSGLGAQGTGITTALRVQVEKAKRKPDSEGGGLVGGTKSRGKIIGGKRKDDEEGSSGKFGDMSEVVVLQGMVDGMDLQQELGEGNLMQEIGEECGEKYGNVERVFIDQSVVGSVPVFVKFTSPLSALRAVNALEGRIFNGNTITARFYDKDRFDRGDYAV